MESFLKSGAFGRTWPSIVPLPSIISADHYGHRLLSTASRSACALQPAVTELLAPRDRRPGSEPTLVAIRGRSPRQLPPLLQRRGSENARGTYQSRPPPARSQRVFLGGAGKTFTRAPRAAAGGTDSAGDPPQRIQLQRGRRQGLLGRIRLPFLGWPAALSTSHPRDRRPRGHEARPPDRPRDSDLAPARRSAADSRPGHRLHHASRRYRGRRLLLRV